MCKVRIEGGIFSIVGEHEAQRVREKDKTIPVKKVRCTAASRSSVSLNISAAYQKWRVKSPGIETT